MKKNDIIYFVGKDYETPIMNGIITNIITNENFFDDIIVKYIYSESGEITIGTVTLKEYDIFKTYELAEKKLLEDTKTNIYILDPIDIRKIKKI
jgi:hypothetical protein